MILASRSASARSGDRVARRIETPITSPAVIRGSSCEHRGQAAGPKRGAVNYRCGSNDLRKEVAERVGFEPTWGVMPPTDFESVPL